MSEESSKPNTQKFLENFQEEMRERADGEELSYADDRIYGMMMMLDSYLNENLSLEEALEEYLHNSSVELRLKVNH